ncbi:hypothetical protein [[Pseudopropionibacterium] massiliense]|uniref:hypothetical protein n=1 Tax=[Pseudopropionibacterium] massiliense TaxID=2220000 RepID=UPI00103157A0|nr:hypothetical protein [[Pseudopropionibacterium] massiliense]
MSAVTYSRPISGIERGYLNVAAQHDHPMIHLVLEGKGSLEPRALEAAVASACDANPGIAVVRRGTRWVGGGPLPAVISHAAPLTNANDVDLFRQGLDVVGGPVAEVHLFGHESTTLVLRATHAVSDGRGLQHWLRDVFRVLRGETPLGAPDTATDQHFVRTVKACRKPNTESSSSAPHARLSAPLFGATEAGGCIRWTRRTIATSASAMSARIAAAVARYVGAAVTVIIPVDLRRHDPTVNSTANLSAQLPLQVSPEESWQRIYGRLLKLLAQGRETDTLRMRFQDSNPYANTLEQAQAIKSDTCPPYAAIISDHGVMDLKPFVSPGFAPTRLSSFPLLVPYVGTFISSFTNNGMTHLTVAHREGDDPNSIAGLLDDIEKITGKNSPHERKS